MFSCLPINLSAAQFDRSNLHLRQSGGMCFNIAEQFSPPIVGVEQSGLERGPIIFLND